MIEVEWAVSPVLQEVEAAVVKAASAALLWEKRTGDLTILVVSGERIQQLNREFRHKDAVTDVLTFPAWEGEALLSPPDGYLGDIAICLKRAEEQAMEYGHSLLRECGFLAVHGVLHLLSYDHMEPEEERTMLEHQKTIMEEAGLPR